MFRNVEAISVLIDEDGNGWTFPLIDLLQWQSLQYILLGKVSSIQHITLPGDFREEPSTEPCEKALGHTPPYEKNAICLSVPANFGPPISSSNCQRYELNADELLRIAFLEWLLACDTFFIFF